MVEYPHLRAQLEGENVESFKEICRADGGEKGWDVVLGQIKEWLV